MRILLPLTLLALAGCQEPRSGEASNEAAGADPAQPAAVIPVATSSAEAEAIAEEQPRAEGPASAGAFRWTGRFAATPELCEGGAWRFSNEGVETAGETSCKIGKVTEGEGGVELTLSCTAEGMASDERWMLTRTERGMNVVRRGPGNEVTVDLQRCA